MPGFPAILAKTWKLCIRFYPYYFFIVIFWHLIVKTKPAQKVSNIDWDSIPHAIALPRKKTENEIEDEIEEYTCLVC